MSKIKYELGLFSGIGGGLLGGHLLGWRCVGAVEIVDYRRRVLLQRQRDGVFKPFPIWDDVRTFSIENPDCRAYIEWLISIREKLVISAGFPCSDISSARTNNHVNGKIRGINGSQSGLWWDAARIVREIRPAKVIVENSPNLVSRGLGLVLGDFSEMGYDARWGVFSARGFGADHIRKRMFVVATNANQSQRKGGCLPRRVHAKYANAGGADWWENQPGMERVAHGIPNQFQRLASVGDAQIPAVVRLAYETLSQ